MTDKQKLSEIRFICTSHIGDKLSMAQEIIKVIDQKKHQVKKNS